MRDPLVELARQRVIKASADLEVQIASRSGSAPLLLILDSFRDKAAESLAALATTDAEDPKLIRVLQNEVKRYDELIEEMRALIARGRALEAERSAADRDELLEILVQTEEGQQEAIDLGMIDDPAAARG